MIVRSAIPPDEDHLVDMARAFFASSPMYSKVEFEEGAFRNFLWSSEAQVWVADAGVLVGMAAAVVFPLYFAPTSRVAQEIFWWVEPDFRGSGAGDALRCVVEKWAKDQGAEHLFMIALENERSPAMERLYRMGGFSPIERTYSKGL